MRYLVGPMLLALLLTSGCSSLRYETTEDLWEQSEEHFDTGDYEEAIAYYDELIRRDDEDALAYLMRGLCHERAGNTGDAIDDYRTAGRLGESKALLYSANLNIIMGDTAAAEEDLGKLRDAGLGGRDQVIQLTLLGTLRLKQGRHRMAAQSLTKAVELGRGFTDAAARKHVADAHYNASEAYYHMGDFRRAYDHFLGYAGLQGPVPQSEQALVDSPSANLSGEDYFMLGLLAYLNHDFEAAEAHLSRADPELVSQASEILDDPSFAANEGGLK